MLDQAPISRPRVTLQGGLAMAALMLVVTAVVLVATRDHEAPPVTSLYEVDLRTSSGSEAGLVRLLPGEHGTRVEFVPTASAATGEYQLKLGTGTCERPGGGLDDIKSSFDGRVGADGRLTLERPFSEIRGLRVTMYAASPGPQGGYTAAACGVVPG